MADGGFCSGTGRAGSVESPGTHVAGEALNHGSGNACHRLCDGRGRDEIVAVEIAAGPPMLGREQRYRGDKQLVGIFFLYHNGHATKSVPYSVAVSFPTLAPITPDEPTGPLSLGLPSAHGAGKGDCGGGCPSGTRRNFWVARSGYPAGRREDPASLEFLSSSEEEGAHRTALS